MSCECTSFVLQVLFIASTAMEEVQFACYIIFSHPFLLLCFVIVLRIFVVVFYSMNEQKI